MWYCCNPLCLSDMVVYNNLTYCFTCCNCGLKMHDPIKVVPLQ